MITRSHLWENGDDVWSMQPDGSDQRRLTQTPWYEGDPAVSPQGDRIAVSLQGSSGSSGTVGDTEEIAGVGILSSTP